MAETLQATHGVGLVIGRDQMEFSAAVFHQAAGEERQTSLYTANG